MPLFYIGEEKNIIIISHNTPTEDIPPPPPSSSPPPLSDGDDAEEPLCASSTTKANVSPPPPSSSPPPLSDAVAPTAAAEESLYSTTDDDVTLPPTPPQDASADEDNDHHVNNNNNSRRRRRRRRSSFVTWWRQPREQRISGPHYWCVYWCVVTTLLVSLVCNVMTMHRYAVTEQWLNFIMYTFLMAITVFPINILSYWWSMTDAVSAPHLVWVTHGTLMALYVRLYQLGVQVWRSNASKTSRCMCNYHNRMMWSIYAAQDDLGLLLMINAYCMMPTVVLKIVPWLPQLLLLGGGGGRDDRDMVATIVDIVYAVNLLATLMASVCMLLIYSRNTGAFDKGRHTQATVALLMPSRLLLFITRIVALTCLFAALGYRALFVCLLVICTNLVWFRCCDKDTDFTENQLQEFIFHVIMSIVGLFGVLNIPHTPATVRYACYYSFSFLGELLAIAVYVVIAGGGSGDGWWLCVAMPYAFVIALLLQGLNDVLFCPGKGQFYIPRRNTFNGNIFHPIRIAAAEEGEAG